MFSILNLFIIVFVYLLILFSVAYYAERMEKKGKSIVNNPYIYSLSLAVYCTSWTFYGSVGKAATSGLSFLTTYLGPTLMAVLFPVVMKKVLRLAKTHRITTISDFISSRYGRSLTLSAIITIVAFVGLIPYLGLQIKAIITTLMIISTRESIPSGYMHTIGISITLMLGIFAIIFGARRLDSSERHGGLVFAIAFESIVKLTAFIMVGIFVTFGLFDGFGDIFQRIMDSDRFTILFLGYGTETGYSEWFTLTLLSMMAIIFLPRQFQMSVVENYDESHLYKASWLFPLYLFLINIFVLPVAMGGILLGYPQTEADYFVLTLPLNNGMKHLALFAFIGGFSAATSMVIVESLALSTMIMNSIVMPGLIRFHRISAFPAIVLNIKRLIILIVVFMGYIFYMSIGEYYSLVDIGLKSFEAVALFSPSFFLGLYWKRANSKGAILGLIAGFIVWFYTLIIPAFMRAGIIGNELSELLSASGIFNPLGLFGLHGLDRYTHSLIWSMLLNTAIFVGISIFTKQSREEEIQSIVFVESYEKMRELHYGRSYTLNDIEEILSIYLGRNEAEYFIYNFLTSRKKRRDELGQDDILVLRNEAERLLSGAIGSSMAALVFEDKFIITEKEKEELSESIRHITENLRLSRQELAEANRTLSYLKAFSENIIESVPLGIVSIDSSLNISYWNRKMELLTGIKRERAQEHNILSLIPWIPEDIFVSRGHNERILEVDGYSLPCKRFDKCIYRVEISALQDPSGGYVLIFEDITEKRMMEEQLFQTSKLASLGKLTAGISHEIGNPLAAISSLAQELLSIKESDIKDEMPFLKESLQEIRLHIERIGRIVRSLSDFARISPVQKQRMDVGDILERVINLMRYDKRFKNIKLNVKIDKTPLIMINPDRIQQVFINLILNALDAMPDGGSLNIEMRRDGDDIFITFEDTGHGMDGYTVKRIFDPFFTTKPQGKGTGLGLSICYGIIKDHGGTITVWSKKGKGTKFLIRLPIKDVAYKGSESTN